MIDWGAIAGAIKAGADPYLIIILVLCGIIAKELHELNRATATQTAALRAIDRALENHNAHQSSRMEEIRRYMLSLTRRLGEIRPNN